MDGWTIYSTIMVQFKWEGLGQSHSGQIDRVNYYYKKEEKTHTPFCNLRAYF